MNFEELTGRGFNAAMAAARRLGIECDEPELLSSFSNVIVWLRPAPLVARVATLLGSVRAEGGRDAIEAEIELARFLDAAGIPVVRPAADPLAGPHREEELWLSIWEHAEGAAEGTAIDVTAEMLRDLHRAMRGFERRLPLLGPVLEDLPGALDRLRAAATAGDDVAFLRDCLPRVRERILALGLPHQPIHGDPHPGNLLDSPRGLAWTDLEEASLGPIHWDLACLVTYSQLATEPALEAYGAELDPGELDPFIDARLLQSATWNALLASWDMPGLAARARERLAQLRERLG